MKPHLLALAGVAALGPPAAHAQQGNGTFSVSGIIDARAGLASGEQSWLDRGFGKLRSGGSTDGDVQTDIDLARGALVLRGHFDWDVSVYTHIEFDPEHDHFADIGEAWVRYKPIPKGPVRYEARIGAFYPPVSREHDGVAWSTTRTITPSAINSWIGEEVKVAGLEGSVRAKLGEDDVTFTAAAFGFNDTSGTLLTFRGWALHDRQVTLNGDFPLPEYTPRWWSNKSRQSQSTEPFREIDGRAGFYGRMEWRPAWAPLSLDVLHYDNAGDRQYGTDGQNSWETRFTNIGVSAQLTEKTSVLAQAMTGQTLWVPLVGEPIAFVDDVNFDAAYILLDHAYGDHGASMRVDVFATNDNQAFNKVSTPEDGWALTAAWRSAFWGGLHLIVEGQFVDSARASRRIVGEEIQQSQLSLQSSMRWRF